MESLSHMYVLPYHILGNLLRKEKQDSHLAAPPNAKAGGGALMQVKSYATLPPRKSGLHAASCHDVPCCVLALLDWLYSSSLIIS